MTEIVRVEHVENLIYTIRAQHIMLDEDLARLYTVETKALNQAVRRNLESFPDDFMFQLTQKEFEILRSQNVTFKALNRKYLPYAFTEEGVSMLSTVLKSKRATQVKIAIMRAFVRMRRMLIEHKELSKKLDELEKRHDKQFRGVFAAIRELMRRTHPPHTRAVGFLNR